MSPVRKGHLIILLSIMAISALAQDKKTEIPIDGPYIFHKETGLEVIRIATDGLLIEKELDNSRTFNVSSHDEKHHFSVNLHPVCRPEWKYIQQGDIMVISDPHANFDTFLSILRAQKVIGDDYQWTFGNNHLVIIGDVFDRGYDVLPIFWLIYKLEYEAEKAGGKVHFLLGNHEEMVLRDNLKYTKESYKDLAKELNTQYNKLWMNDSELGNWLLTRNTIEIIGDNLFVHAGLSKELSEQNWLIPQLNDTISAYIHLTKEERKISPAATFLFGNNGPLWYRGMVRTDEKYNPIPEADVDHILKQYKVKRIYVGHTIFDEVSIFYGGKVIAVNVDNKKNKDNGLSRGILISKNKKFLIYDDLKKNRRIITKFRE